MSTLPTVSARLITDWREAVTFSSSEPQPQFLETGPELKVVLAGLEPGQSLPPHPESQAVYHFLEGVGSMNVDEQVYPVKPGMTVIVPAGATRGMVAETRLVFLAVKSEK